MDMLTDPVQVGDLQLANRIVMAPLTRARSAEGNVPTELNARYYQQRATAGLVITEATNVAANSCAFEKAPGIWSQEQVYGWERVVDGVHSEGGRIFMQLWHCGRVGSAALLNGKQPLSPSGVNDDLRDLNVWAQLENGHYVPISATPSREMTLAEIQETIEAYRRAAANAVSAGFDGVEIHAANGYLPNQFLSPTLNTRSDQYGGSAAKRARFLSDVIEQVAKEFPIGRIGVRLSPFATYNSPRDPNPDDTYSYVSDLLQSLRVGYVHIADMNGWFGKPDLPKLLDIVRPRYTGKLIVNGGIAIEQGRTLIRNGSVDMVAFGRLMMANPDLVTRIKDGAPLADVRSTGWYAGGAEGYTDYPTYSM